MTGETIAATEAWFRRQGIPHFIEDYNPRRAVFTRGLPFLTVVLFIEVLTVINTEWPWWANALTMIGMIALVAGAWGGAVSLRRGNPFRMPARAGVAQLAVFVLAPSLLTGIVQNLWAIAVWQVLMNLLVLGIVYVTVSFALLPVLGWAVRRLFRDMRDVIGLFARALPLLLLFLTFLFINSEVWNVASGLERGSRNLVIAVFGLMGGAFLISRLPAELGQLGRFASAEQVAGLVRGTPVEGVPVTDAAVRLDEPLGRRQWLNAGLVVLFALALRVLFVSVLVAVFLLVLGLAAIDESLIAAWNGEPPETLLRLGGPEGAAVTAELLRVALFLGTFSGFYFTVKHPRQPRVPRRVLRGSGGRRAAGLRRARRLPGRAGAAGGGGCRRRRRGVPRIRVLSAARQAPVMLPSSVQGRARRAFQCATQLSVMPWTPWW